jgi:protein TonB
MPSTTTGKPGPESARPAMALRRCLVEGDPEATSRARRRRRKAFGVSIAIEGALLVLLVAVPLLTSVAQPQLHPILPPQLTFFRAWRERDPAHQSAPPTTTREPELASPFPHPEAPVTIVDIHRVEEAGEGLLADLPVGPYIPGAIEIAEGGKSQSPVEPPRIAQPAQPEKRVVRLSEPVIEAQLISRVEPQYPPLAIQTRTEGTVRLHAIISREGRITSLDVLSGHPFLVKAALDAVRQWRYRPTMLNGEPVEVETFITVIFRLHEQR